MYDLYATLAWAGFGDKTKIYHLLGIPHTQFKCTEYNGHFETAAYMLITECVISEPNGYYQRIRTNKKNVSRANLFFFLFQLLECI